VTPEIPNYTMLHLLGEGAMAEVWLAQHKRNSRKAAIKVLKSVALKDADVEKLFLREGEVLAGFDHSNIVKIYDNDRIGNLAYLAMEYLAGGTLLERMQRGPINVGEALGLVTQIAGALEAAHRQQVVHRDLKPANIMFRDETTPVLTDFGAVRVLDKSTIYGRDGGIIGTPIYMSPEQITGQPLTGTSDLYALGVIFHELLTGRRPYPGGSIQEIATQHLYAPVPQLPVALAMLQPILERLLAKVPEQRYGHAQEFVDALRHTFINDETLRRQIGFSGTSMAWSSQLRALGFVLDPAQKNEVRRAQGEFLREPPLAPVQPEARAARPTAAPPRAPAVHPPRSRKTLQAVIGGTIIAILATFLWLEFGGPAQPEPPAGQSDSTQSESSGASAPLVSAQTAPSASSVSESDVLAARDRYTAALARLKALATREQRDVAVTLARAEVPAKLAAEAQLAKDLEGAVANWGAATLSVNQEAIRLLDEVMTDYANRAKVALRDGKLAPARQWLERGKQLRAERADFPE